MPDKTIADDPLTETADEIVPNDGSTESLRKQLQALNAYLIDRRKYKKEQNKIINGQIKDLEEEIAGLVEQLEAMDKTL